MRSTVGKFCKMPPASYEPLLTKPRPQVIETWKQYQTIAQRFGDFVGKGRAGSAGNQTHASARPVDPGLRPPARYASGRFRAGGPAPIPARTFRQNIRRSLARLRPAEPCP